MLYVKVIDNVLSNYIVYTTTHCHGLYSYRRASASKTWILIPPIAVSYTRTLLFHHINPIGRHISCVPLVSRRPNVLEAQSVPKLRSTPPERLLPYFTSLVYRSNVRVQATVGACQVGAAQRSAVRRGGSTGCEGREGDAEQHEPNV